MISSECEEELKTLSGVRDELEKVSTDKNCLQKELSNLEGKYKVMETLRDSQETELQTLKVKTPAAACFCVLLIEIYSGGSFISSNYGFDNEEDACMFPGDRTFNCVVFFWSLFSLQMKLSVQEATLARLQTNLRDTEEEVRSLKDTVAQQKDELHAGEMERRRLHNTIQELKASQRLL